MGKLTISIAIFNSFLYVYQAGYVDSSPRMTGWRVGQVHFTLDGRADVFQVGMGQN